MKRMEGELYYDYKARRIIENKERKNYLKGRMIHLSAVLDNIGSVLKPVWRKRVVDGTYRKPVEEEE